MGGAHLDHIRVGTGTFRAGPCTSFLEIAVIRHIDGVGDVAGDVEQRVAVGIQRRLGFLQTDGVGVAGIVEDLVHRALFNDAAGVHHHHAL